MKTLRIFASAMLALVAIYYVVTLWLYPAVQIREAKQRMQQRLASAPAPVPRTIYYRTTLQGGAGVLIVSGEKTEATKKDGSAASVVREYDGKGAFGGLRGGAWILARRNDG